MCELLLKNGQIFDVFQGKSYPADVLCVDGIIQEIGSALVSPPGCQIVDVTGKLLIPGLFNCHSHIAYNIDYPGRPEPYPFCTNEDAHIISDASRTITSVYLLQQMLSSGVTFIRNVGDRNYIDIALRDAINDKKNTHLNGPDMMCAGKCIIMTGGHGWCDNGLAHECDGVDDVRKAARLQFRNGADMLKLMTTGGIMTPNVSPKHSQFTVEEIKAAVDEAHRVGKTVATHSQGTAGIKNALLAGVDSIEHGIYLDEECIHMMQKQGTYLTPTLCAPIGILGTPGIPDYMIEKSKLSIDYLKKSILMAYDAGIQISIGTDTGTPGNGYDATGNELIYLHQLGLPMDYLIKAATIVSANLCQVADTRGSISVGKYADIAVFEEDLIENPVKIRKCLMTIKHGEILHSII